MDIRRRKQLNFLILLLFQDYSISTFSKNIDYLLRQSHILFNAKCTKPLFYSHCIIFKIKL